VLYIYVLASVTGRVNPDPSVELGPPKGTPSDHTDTGSATESGKRVDFNQVSEKVVAEVQRIRNPRRAPGGPPGRAPPEAPPEALSPTGEEIFRPTGEGRRRRGREVMCHYCLRVYALAILQRGMYCHYCLRVYALAILQRGMYCHGYSLLANRGICLFSRDADS
jgi:hypothetical protein